MYFIRLLCIILVYSDKFSKIKSQSENIGQEYISYKKGK